MICAPLRCALQRLIEKLHWMSNEVFMELFALGSCLPGPTSTQVSFAIGTVRKGVLGGWATGPAPPAYAFVSVCHVRLEKK
jgi:chromate transport protein ChrA